MKKLVLGLLVVAVFLIWDFHRFLYSKVLIDRNILVVERGSGFNDVKEKLLEKNNGLLSSVYYPLFIKYSSPTIKYGPHTIGPESTLMEAVSVLSQDPEDIKVRLPEGERMEAFATIIANYGLSNKKDLLDCFKACAIDSSTSLLHVQTGYEGFLFPDTYIIPPNADAKVITGAVLKNFHSRFDGLAKKYQGFLQVHSGRDVVIIASLLEREARSLQEKRMVAGILYERLLRGMRLDVDATVSYLKGDWRSPLTFADLSIDSPYNTRKNLGLPPGPICNPGLESLEAAMSPTMSGYLYYLTGKNGEMYYARTLDEHNFNKAKYL